MGKREKLLAKLRHNPKNIRFHDLETILVGLGFEEIHGSGSHVKFIPLNHIIVVPYSSEFLKPIYIKQVLQVLKEIEEE